MTDPNETQVGGEHYKKYPIQPWDFIMKNNIPWAEGCIIEWVTRWRDKGGVQDLEKAKHMIDKVIEMAKWSREPTTLTTAQVTLEELRTLASQGIHNPDMVDRLQKDGQQCRINAPHRIMPMYPPNCDCERCSAE